MPNVYDRRDTNLDGVFQSATESGIAGVTVQLLNGSTNAVLATTTKRYTALMDDYENKVTKNFEHVDGVTYLAKTDRKCIIQSQSWLSNSGRLISTAHGNLVLATDELSDMNDIKVVPAMYTIDAGITFLLGLNYQDEDVLRINDQA